ncbi:helix-turn-helix domain-containing protein [Dietzia aurantiaca]|uniref:helix-turn-helix domain-containing protein n=1 Tax=Dietzia aurantiaca TaxID=983873 RepID=UPI001E2D5F62|nr:helix-turn-helix transcriptional regulator [Dietzia aurantiaca]MCD2262455.1 helix-turn-helix domain-containing protein [Dietzia aurantiaca]
MSDGDTAREWATSISNRIGEAVRLRRRELELSAQDVADRTVELGYPITRATISKVENGNRGGKIEVAELLVLAQALETSPTGLLWHDMPDGDAWFLPTIRDTAGHAYTWWSGGGKPYDKDGKTVGNRRRSRGHLRMRTLNELMDTRALLDVAQEQRTEHPERFGYLLTRVAELEERAADEGWTVKGYGEHDDG